jgi:hypothetical protein
VKPLRAASRRFLRRSLARKACPWCDLLGLVLLDEAELVVVCTGAACRWQGRIGTDGQLLT